MSLFDSRKPSRGGQLFRRCAELSSGRSRVSRTHVDRTLPAGFAIPLVAIACLIALVGCGQAARMSGHSVAVASLGGPPSTTPAASAARASAPKCKGEIAIDNVEANLPVLNANCYYQNVPRAKCGPGSHPETGIQGAVPLADRNGNFKGFNCNLQLVGKSQGQGGSWMQAWYGDCEYYDQALPGQPGQTSNGVSVGTYVGTPLRHPGVVVVDAKNPSHPKVTDYLSTPGMIHPWEDLKVNAPRGLLAGQLIGGSPLDVYSVRKNCAHPTLLSSTPLKDFGHEGQWEPDGRTYWATSLTFSEYHAVDMTDPRHPREILDWKLPDPSQHLAHGMAFSPNGKTAYFTVIGSGLGSTPGTCASARIADDGFIIADISSIQDRSAHPHVRIISEVTYLDGGVAQVPIPFTEGRNHYLVMVDELGVCGLGDAANWKAAIADGLPPFGDVHIFNINNPAKPTLVSHVTLQTNDPKYWKAAVQQVIQGGQTVFSYDTHYCSIDTPVNTTALACGYFNSGVRVFDIRNPAQPREIAYYNPPSAQAKIKDLAGSEHAQTETRSNLTKNGLSADWCSSQSRFYTSGRTHYLWIQCQDNGFQILKFANNAYPPR
jgi:hypothetical protein